MLIPSIDLMSGRIVQLERGERLVIESDDFDGWIARFARFPMVQLIDLDAAMGRGDNAARIDHICARLPCQVGGGVRTVERARQLISAGAKRVITGSALFGSSGVERTLAAQFADALGVDAFVAAIDTRANLVLTHGWTKAATVSPIDAIAALEPHAGTFLFTDVEREGLLGGFDLAVAARLRGTTTRRLIVAGGIRDVGEIQALHDIGVDAVVGMAVYRGLVACD